MQAQDRDRILSLAAELENLNPLPDATRHLDRVAGRWRLLFSTITILVRCYTSCWRDAQIARPHHGCQRPCVA